MKKIILIILLILAVAGSFYGGMKYAQSKNSFSNFSRQNFQNLTSEERQQIFQGNVEGSLQAGVRTRAGMNFINGEVISKDDQSLTLKTVDGGSSIVFFSDSTQISKTIEGTIDDIGIGQQIMITGEQNSDGSYTAATIQPSSSHLAPDIGE